MHTALYDDLLITKTPPFRNVPERRFLAIIKGYSHITVLTPEIMHEIIDSIVIHAPDKSSGHRKQMVDPNFTVHFVDTTNMSGCTISSSLSFTSVGADNNHNAAYLCEINAYIRKKLRILLTIGKICDKISYNQVLQKCG